MKKVKRKDLVYPDLSYKVVGVLFDVYNNLGPGYSEKYYQKAIAEELKRREIRFAREVVFPISYKDIKIGFSQLDFLIDNKLILEIKRGGRFSTSNIEQIFNYLKATNLKLAILANITKEGVVFRRAVNSYIRK